MASKCSELGIPEELHRKNRPIDNTFESEMIYRRFQSSASISEWSKDGKLSSSIFPVKRDSCNREKYSTSPKDVLYNIREEDEGKHYFDIYGVVGFSSEVLYDFQNTSLMINDEVRKFTLQLSHSPEECMYPHCEILVLENGQEVTLNAKSIKTAIRVYLVQNCKILIPSP